MNITKIAINSNRVTYVVLLLIIVMGIIGYKSLSRDSMPPYTIRTATVVTNFLGAGPDRIETLVSDKIEEVVQEIPEVDYVESESRTGISIVTVTLKENVLEAELQPIWDRLRRKVDLIRPDLPDGINGPTVKDDDIGVVYGIIAGFESDGFEYEETKEYADDLKKQLIALENAAKVELGGVIDERIFVDFNDANLSKYGLSGSQLKSSISSTNIIIPAGEVNLGEERIIIEPTGNLESVEDIENLLIPIGQKGETIKLGDLTTVRRDYVTPRKSLVKLNGREGISLYISLKKGANIIQLGSEVDALLADYNQYLPIGLNVKRIASQDIDVATNVQSFVTNVMQSIVIVLLVMLFFLGLRTGLVVASLIPLAIICTLLFMGIFDIGLNQVSLAALIMALGMLVDNAIVVAESMMVKMESGESATSAAISSSKELTIPLLISSLTTSAAFLAFYLAESSMGEIMGQLFLVITIALLSSWVMALTIVPLLAIFLIKVNKNKKKKKSIFDMLNKHYNRLLLVVLKKPFLTIVSIAVLFFASIYGFGKLPFTFMPDSERNLVTFDLNLPLGTSIETTQENILIIEDYIRKNLLVNESRDKGISDWSAYIGKGPNSYDLGYTQGEANSGYAHLLLNTSSGEDNQMVIDSLEAFCFNKLPDAQTTIKRLGSGGGAAVPVEIRLSGDNIGELYLMVNAIKDKLLTIPGSKNVDDDWGPKIKKLIVQVDQTKLSQSGLTNQDIALSLNTYLSGQNVGDYREDDNTIPIVMQAAGNQNTTFEKIESLSIFSQRTGKNIPLAQVASILPDWQYAKILRRDLKRTITVNCELQNGYTASDITSVLKPWIEEQYKSWKRGYEYELGGEAESSSDAMGAVIAKLPLAFFIIVLLLVVQFNSIRKTVIVLATIPLGIIGVVGGLLAAQSYFSFTAFLGVISLAGIVINNAIVLLDRIEMEIDVNKRGSYDAIIQATNERFRPILLTTFTTSLGLIPLWLGGGAMWEPMAIGIIFGLLFATVITLLFVPVVYKLLFKVKLNG
jgi:multidrug efflux pump subunit AcrB